MSFSADVRDNNRRIKRETSRHTKFGGETMTDDEKMLWELFCETGEPRYYSMYVRAKRDGEDRKDR